MCEEAKTVSWLAHSLGRKLFRGLLALKNVHLLHCNCCRNVQITKKAALITRVLPLFVEESREGITVE